MNQIRKFFDLNKDVCFQRIDDNLSRDLNIDDLFDAIDYTYSSIGQQFLYNLLRNIPLTNYIKSHEGWLDSYSKNGKMAGVLNSTLSRLNNYDAYNLYSIITEKHQPLKLWKRLSCRVLQFAPTIFLALFILINSIWFLLGLLASFILNLVIHYRSKQKSFLYSGSIPQLYNMLNVATKLHNMPEIAIIKPDLKKSFEVVKPLKNQLRIFRFDVKLESEYAIIMWFITEMFRIFFLVELITFNKFLTLINKYSASLNEIFNFVGLVDTLQSISRLRKDVPYYCLPNLNLDEGTLLVKDIYHPLILNCVENSFSMHSKSFLIMGSNMSGKTSFVRSVGINVLLAQTLNTCFAMSMQLHPQKIYSAIAIKDSLSEGHSYYLSEVLRIKDIIERTEEGHNLILLDELFKGTNTIERVAGAKAVLQHLSTNNKNRVLVATHDIELLNMLSDNFIPIYFTENIHDKELSFDYKIKYEDLTHRNAIRILELYNFPSSIIDEALSIVKNLENKYL